jgi:hypothetical protein
MRRYQARRGNGRWTRNTCENTFGLHVEVCPHADCRAFNPYGIGEPKPEECHRCGRPFAVAVAADPDTPDVNRHAPQG